MNFTPMFIYTILSMFFNTFLPHFITVFISSQFVLFDYIVTGLLLCKQIVCN